MPPESPDTTAETVNSLVAEATEALEAGDADAALDLLRQAAAVAPLRPDVRDLMAVALDRSLSAESGGMAARSRRSARSARAGAARGEIRRPMRAPGLPALMKALSFLMALAVVSVIVVGVFFFRGQIYNRIRRWIDHTLVVDPQEEARREFVQRAEGLLREGLYDACIEYVRERRDKFPELQDRIKDILAEAQFQTGEAFSRKNRYEEAMEHYREAVSLAPGRADFHHAEGWNFYVYARQQGSRSKNYSLFLGRAERSIQQAISLSPETAAYYLDLGQVYVAMDRRDKAIEQFKKALELAGPESDEGRRAERLMKMLLE
ncbi:MAG: hypothetical protein Kow0059_06650 [Candidatus Sumerlaeia bacterium]